MTNLDALASNAAVPAAGLAADTLAGVNVLLNGGRTLGVGTLAGVYKLDATPPDGYFLMYFDSADYAVAGKTLQFQMRAWYHCASAQSGTYRWALYPIASATGPSGGTPILTLDPTRVSFSAVTWVAPPSGLQHSSGDTGDFNPPAAAGYYMLALEITATTVGSNFETGAQLRARWT